MDYNNLIRKRTFVLETKSTCFLCLQENPGGEEKDKASGCGERFSLRSILLYLKLNPRKVFDKLAAGLPGPLKNTVKLLKEISNFSVTLCEECEKVAEKLSELCQELEQIQMRVDNCLETFYELLAFSENDAVQREQFRKKMASGPLEFIQRMIAEALRKETKDKCGIRLNLTQPKVNLRKSDDSEKVSNTSPSLLTRTATTPTSVLQSTLVSPGKSPPLAPVIVPLVTTTTNSDPSVLKLLLSGGQPLSPIQTQPQTQIVSFSQQSCEPCGVKFSSKDSWTSHVKLQCLLNGSTAKKTLMSPNQTVRKASIKQRFKCPHCTDGIFESNIALSRHQAQFHAEQFLLSSKQPHLSEKTFKNDCEQLLQTLVAYSRVKTVAADGKDVFKCVYCSDSKTMKLWPCFYIHLVKAHQDVIAKKLMTLQDKKYGWKPSLQKEQFCPPPPDKKSLKSSKFLLNAWIKQKALALDMANARNRKIATPVPPLVRTVILKPKANISNTLWKCEICQKTYNSPLVLHTHWTENHAAELQKQINNDSVATVPTTSSSIINNESVPTAVDDDNMFEETEVYPSYVPHISVKKEKMDVMESDDEIISQTEDICVDKVRDTRELTTNHTTNQEEVLQDNLAMLEETEMENEDEDSISDNDDNDHIDGMNYLTNDDDDQMWVNGDLLE